MRLYILTLTLVLVVMGTQATTVHAQPSPVPPPGVSQQVWRSLIAHQFRLPPQATGPRVIVVADSQPPVRPAWMDYAPRPLSREPYIYINGIPCYGGVSGSGRSCSGSVRVHIEGAHSYTDAPAGVPVDYRRGPVGY